MSAGNADYTATSQDHLDRAENALMQLTENYCHPGEQVYGREDGVVQKVNTHHRDVHIRCLASRLKGLLLQIDLDSC